MSTKDLDRPSVLIMVGLPASGKSTARAKAKMTGASAASHHYSTDDHIDAYAAEVGMTYSEVFQDYVKAATALADQGLEGALTKKQNVIWDQTNMTAKKRRQILNRFPREYRKECICILPPFTNDQVLELARRLESRPGKNVPKFVMQSMRNSFELPSESEGYARVMYFDIYGNIVDRNQAADLFGKLNKSK